MKTQNDIETWLVAYLAEWLRIPEETIDVSIPVSKYGVDSADAANLTLKLEQWLGVEVDPVLAYEYPTIRLLSGKLAKIAEISVVRNVDVANS